MPRLPARRAIVGGLLTVATLLPLLPASAVHADPSPAVVVRIVDGDTVDVQLGDGRRERLRLVGMDTPETVDPRKLVQCFGQEATSRARALLAGQRVTIDGDPTQEVRDRYGRLLVYLWLADGTFFNQQMIAEGYAHEYTYHVPYQYQADFRAAEHAAQEQGLGLWNESTCAGQAYPGLSEAPAVVTDLDENGATLAAYTGPYDPFGPDRDCADFSTWDEAQAFFLAAGGPEQDPHHLDADHDGIACEALAAVAQVPGLPASVVPPPAPPLAPPTPTAAPAAPVPAPGFDPRRYLGQGDRYNCADFASQAQAQAVLRADATDPNRLDADRDGIACESNRAPFDRLAVPRP